MENKLFIYFIQNKNFHPEQAMQLVLCRVGRGLDFFEGVPGDAYWLVWQWCCFKEEALKQFERTLHHLSCLVHFSVYSILFRFLCYFHHHGIRISSTKALGNMILFVIFLLLFFFPWVKYKCIQNMATQTQGNNFSSWYKYA